MEMKNKVALVTGAARGFKDGGDSIGSAIALKLAAAGAKVVVVDVLEEMGQKTVEMITQNGGKAIFVQADTSQMEEVKRAVRTAEEKFGGLHCLVNCAASYEGDIFHPVTDTPEEDWLRIFDVNLHGYFRFAKHSIPLILKSGGGTIVNISSMAAHTVVPDFAVYPVTKAAINGLTRTLAVDHSPEIRTNAICPGFVKIANSEGNRSEEEVRSWHESIASGYPAQRVCSVDEIAEVALFLASERSSYMNGSCLKVDSGRSVGDTFDYGK